MNTIIVKTNNATQTVRQTEVITKDGIPTIIKAMEKVNYEFHDNTINRAPNHIITKRVENDLYVSFEEEGKETDLIIEGFYDSADSALLGMAEDGEYYYYVPDTGETYDYVTQLEMGDIEGQALGGEAYVAAPIPWWIPAAAGLGIAGLLASTDSNSRDDRNIENGTAPLVENEIQTGTLGQPVTIFLLSSATDLEGDIDPTSVKLINPDTGLEVTSLTVAGEGEWVVDPETGTVTFTPEAGFTADPTPVNYVVSDLTGNKSNQATITVDYPPTAPNAEDEVQTGSLGQPVVIDVLDNDTDLEGDIDPTSVKLINPDTGLEVTSLTVAGEGEWVVDPETGTVTFTPEAGFTADPTPVNYVVSDLTGNKSNQATITVDYPPTAPNAEDEVQTGSLGQPVVIDVLDNDTDLEGDIDPTSVKLINPDTGLEVTSLTVAGEGEWVVDPETGTVTFTPEAGFTADPTPVNYVVSDLTGNKSNQATITVDYPPTAPNAEDEVQTGSLGQPVVIDVLDNDTDLEGDIDPTSVKLINPDTGLEVTSLTVAGEGEWVVDPETGTVTFTPEAGFTADPTPVNYVVSDLTGNKSNQATITVDYPPTAPNAEDEVQTGSLGQPVVIDVLDNDTDLEGDIDPTSVKLINPDTGLEVTSLTVAGEGEWVVDPETGTVTFTPEAGFTADPTPVNYVVSDLTGNKSNQATITVDYPPTAPNAEDEVQTGSLGQPVVIDVLDNDTDLEGDIDPTSVKLINPDTGLEVTSLTVAGEGEWVVDPETGTVTFTPEAGFTADPTPVNYVVSDLTGNKSNQATITVDYPPTAPNAEDEVQTGSLGQPVVIDVLDNDTDLEGDIDPTSVKLINPDTGLEVTSLTVAGEGEWVVDPETGTVTFTPEAGFTADPTPVNYVVSDLTGNKSNQATITVDYPPTAPNAEDEVQTGSLGQPVVIDVLDNDTDLEGDIDPTSVKLINPDTGLEVTSLTVAGEGEWVVDPETGTVTFTPEAGFTADPTPVNYVVSDLTGNKSNQATITVDYPPTAPNAEDEVQTGSLGQPVVIDVLDNDTDLEGDIDPTSVKLINPDTGLEVTSLTVAGEGEWVVDPETGTVTFTPEAGFTADPTPVNYVVSDLTGNKSNQATITVDYPPTAPNAEDEVQTGSLGQPVVIDVLDNDTDLEGDIDPTSVKLINPDTGLEVTSLTVAGEGEWVVDPETGTVTFTPEAGFTADPTPVNYVVSDLTGNKSNQATITVDYPPTAPVAVDDTYSVDEDSSVVLDPLNADSDLDGDELSITNINGTDLTPGVAQSITVSNGVVYIDDQGIIRFTPDADFNGEIEFDYTITDGTATATATETITVDPVNDAPVAAPEVESTDEDTTLTDNVLPNDTDVDGDILTVQSATVDIDGSGIQTALVLGSATALTDNNGDAIGDLTLNADGSYTFDPAPDFNGTVPTVNYTVTDPDGLTDSTTLDITVDPVNDAPVAAPEVESTDEDTTLTDNVLPNDTDVDGDILTVQSATVDIDGSGIQTALVLGSATALTDNNGDAIGDLTLNADGSYTFDPAPDFNGTVPTVNYTVTDPDGLTDSTTLDITVDPVNDIEANPEVEITPEDTVLTDNVLTNDTDEDGTTLAVQSATVDIDGSGIQTALVLGSATALTDNNGDAIGDLTLNADGSYTFDPAPDFNGTVPTVNYTVTDPDGLTDSTTLDITVDPVNDIEANPEVEITPEDTVLTDNVLTNDTDEDGTTLAVQSATVDIDGSGIQTALVLGSATALTDNNGDAIGDLTLNADGSYTFDPAPDFNGTVPTVNYTVTDPDGLTDSTTLDITVDPVNDAPVAAPEVESTDEDTTLTDNVLPNDTDVDGDILTVQSATVDIDGSGIQTALVLGSATALTDNNGDAIGDLTLNADGSYTFDPAPDFNGTVPTVNYTVTDPNGLTDSTTLDITVDPVNDAPVAAPEVESTDEDTTLTDNVLPNDTDVDGDILTVQSATVDIDGSGIQTALVLGSATALTDNNGDAIGDLTLNADGSYTFDPAPDFNGTVPTVNYTVTDPDGLTDSTTLDITVDPVNDAPVAAPEVESTDEDTTLTDNVLPNDTDVDGDILTVQSATVDIDGSGIQTALVLGSATALTDNNGDAIGDLTLNADGSYTFDPAPDFNGTVPTVNYTVTDPNGLTDSTTLDITVDPVNDAPVAAPEVESTDEDTTLTDNVLPNDTDVDGDILTVQSATVDIDGSGIQTALVLGSATALTDNNGDAIGDLTLNADGSYTFDPAPDFNGTVPTVNYTVTDPDGLTDSTTLDITVDPVNDIEANPEVEITPEDTVLTDNVLTNDTDEDGTTLAVQSATVDIDGSGIQTALVLGSATALTDNNGDAIGDLTLNADGSYTFDPAPDFNGTVPTVNYTVTDPDGLTDSTTLDITVDPVNDAPVAAPEVESTDEDTTLTDNVLPNDTDVDGDILTVQSATVDIDGSGIQTALVLGSATALTDNNGDAIGDLTLNADGSYTFDPAPDFNGTVPTVNYTVTDPNGLTDSTTLDITVDPVNDAPVAAPEVESTDEDTTLTDNVLPNDTDVDGDILTVQSATVDIDGSGIQTALVLGSATALTDNNGDAIGDLTLNADGSYTFDPAPDFNGTVPTVNYTVTDPDGLTDSTTLDITVDPVNDAPVAAPEVESTDEDTTLTDNVLPNDTDVDGDILTVQSATVDIDGSGIQTALVLGSATALTDNNGDAIGDLTLNADGSYTFDPAPDFNGTVPTVNYTVTDPDGLTDSTTLDITVDPVNDAPVAAPEVESTDEDTTLTDNVLPNDTDVDGDILTVQSATVDIDGSGIQTALVLGSATALTDNNGDAIGDLTLNADGSYTFDPAPDFNGTVPTVNYTVTDPDGLTDSTTFDITVDPVNDAPVAAPEVESTDEDTTLTDNVLPNDTDVDGDILTVQSATVDIDGSGIQTALVLGSATALTDNNGDAIGDLTLNADGSYTFDPAPDFNGTVPTVNYTVTDPDGLTDSTTLDITVDPVNDAPVAAPEVESTDEDTTLTDNVLPNDTDVDGDILTVQSATVDIDGSGIQTALVLGSATALTDNNGDAIGDLTLNADGSYTFDPAPDFNGTVPTVNYTVTDPDGLTDSTTLDITVDPVNDAPVAAPEVESTDEDTTLTDNVLPNDTDVDGDILTVQSATVDIDGSGIQTALVLGSATALTDNNGDAIGDLTLNADGSYTFDPAPDFNGTVPTVNYTVTDPDGLTDSTTLDITVDPVNDAPVAAPEVESTDEDTTLTDNVLPNDTDVDGDILTVQSATVDIDGSGIQTALVLGSATALTDNNGDAIGDLTLNADGSYTFDPAPDFNGTVPTVNYTVTDPDGLTDSTTLDITVDPVNDAPVAAPEVESTDEDTTLTDNVLPNDTDVDGDILTVQSATVDIDGSGIQTALVLGSATALTDNNGDAIGDLTLNADGSYTFDPAPDFNGTVPTVNYTVTDPDGLTDSTTLDITVDPVNDAPVAVDDVQAGPLNTAVLVDILANDTDPENDIDPTTVKLIDPADDSEVTTLTVSGEGEWVVDPDTGEVTFTPEAGFTADPTPVEYVVSDITGEQSNPATIVVDYPPTAPVTTDDSEIGVSGQQVIIDVLNNDFDFDGDILPSTVIITQSPAGGTIAADGKSVDVPGEGSWSVDLGTGDITFTPETGFTDDPTPISYTVSDSTGLTSNESTITIDYPQTAPVAADDQKLNQPFGDTITVAVVANDTDVENDLDLTTVKLVDPDNGDEVTTLTVTGEGEWAVDPTSGAVTFTPENGYTGDPTPVDYVVSDRTGLKSNIATITVDYDQLTRIEVEPPGRVSEEGLEGGNPDSDPDSTLDTTDSVTDTDGNWIRVTDTDTDLSNAVVNFVLPATDNGLTSQGNPVVFRIDSSTGDIVGEYEYTDSTGATQIQNVLTIALNGNKEAITDGYQFGYDVTLGAPVDHTEGDDIEGILSVDFGIEVYEDSSATNPLATSDELLAIIEDDSPAPQPVVWNIDVQQETVTITDLQTGFTDSLFTDPTRPVTVDEPSYLVAGSLNTAAGSSGDTIPLRDYGGTVGVLTAEQDATYQAADGNLYVDALDEAIYWGAPADATSSPAGYTTYENTDYQGNGEEIEFESNIDLGDFSHINFGVFGDVGVLLETKLDVNFNIDVNGNSESVAVEYDMKHNETPNNATATTYGLDPADYDDDYVQSDFIVIPDATQIIDIAGQQYQLDLTFVNQDPLVTIDSDRNKEFLKAYQNNNGTDDNGDGLIDQSTYAVVGESINTFTNNGVQGVGNFYDLNGNGIIGDEGDAQFVANLDSGFRYTVIGNSNFAYIDADKDLTSDGIDFDGDNINDGVLDTNGDLDYVVFSTNGRRAEDTDGDGIIDQYDSDGDNIVDTDFALDDYNLALNDENTFVVNSLEGQENIYDIIGKLTPLNPLPELDNNIVVEGKVAVGGDAVDYLNSTGTGIIWSGVSTTDSDTTIETIDTDGDATNYEFQTDYGVFVGYADGSYKFNPVKNIADIVIAGVDDIDVFKFEYTDSDGDTASSTVTLNYNEYATPQSPDSIDDIPSRTTADNDYLVGTNQAETLEGGAGDDTLVGLSGADILSGSDGNDILIFDRNDVSIDGGENSDGSLDNDTLVINDLNVVANTDMSEVVNFETIDLTNDTAQTLSISLSDVVDITDGNNQLFINGDSADTVNVSDMNKSATSDQAGYDLYQDSGNTASLYIQTTIDDNII